MSASLWDLDPDPPNLEPTEEELELALLSWRIIEWKVAYYRPDLVHPSRKKMVEVTDSEFDAAEYRYLTLCKKLGLINTLVHDGIASLPEYADVDHQPMFEVDTSRHSVQLVLEKLGREYIPLR